MNPCFGLLWGHCDLLVSGDDPPATFTFKESSTFANAKLITDSFLSSCEEQEKNPASFTHLPAGISSVIFHFRGAEASVSKSYFNHSQSHRTFLLTIQLFAEATKSFRMIFLRSAPHTHVSPTAIRASTSASTLPEIIFQVICYLTLPSVSVRPAIPTYYSICISRVPLEHPAALDKTQLAQSLKKKKKSSIYPH